MEFIADYIENVAKVANSLDQELILVTIDEIVNIRSNGGRIFVLGMGGSAANASHMVNDLRKICEVEAYCPTDNVSEFSASINDEGLGSYFPRWLIGSNLNKNDAIFILSVGGGNRELNVSLELVNSIDVAKRVGASVLGIVGRDGGYTSKNSQKVIVVPSFDAKLDTAIVEGFQAVVWHALVFHPKLKRMPSKWEEVTSRKK